MGIGYNEMLDLTWREFDYYATGHYRLIERGWDYVRSLVAGNFNSSGFSKKRVKPADIMALPTFDKVKQITDVPKVNAKKIDKMLKMLEHGSNN